MAGEIGAEKRALRDRVRASTMVTVPAHIAASVEAKAKGAPASPTLGASRVLHNPNSILHRGRVARSARGSSESYGDAALEA